MRGPSGEGLSTFTGGERRRHTNALFPSVELFEYACALTDRQGCVAEVSNVSLEPWFGLTRMRRARHRKKEDHRISDSVKTEHLILEAPAEPRRWPVFILIAAAAVVYFNSFSGVALLDDARTIIQNESIRQFSWERLFRQRRPTVWLSLVFNYCVGGQDLWGYHLVNLAVHILAGLTLYGVVFRTLITQRLRASYVRSAQWCALVVALIWLVHPLQTESVTYLIQRSESMMGLFYLLTIYCLIRGSSSSRSRLWHLCAVVACALGMGSKAVMVTAPVVALLYDRVFISQSMALALRRRWAL